MTARVTTLKGAGAGRYYVEALPRYYLESGEPPGRWLGRGAAASNLEGDVDAEAFVAVLSGFDPTGTWVRGRRYGETSVRGFDLTCSAPKSVSVLWAVAPPSVREQIVRAHDAAVAAVVDFVDRHALTRVSVEGQVHVVDAQGVTAAVFRQHTSRAGDPQLHSHVVIAAKVQAPDGRWAALDARGLKCDQRTLSALYHVFLRTELARRLGARWESTVNGIAELATVAPAARSVFSKRTEQVAARHEVKLRRFQADLGRWPTPRERWQLEREAAADSRPAKPTPGSPAVFHALWRAELEAAGHDYRELIRECIRDPEPASLRPAGITAMADQALAALAEQQSTWRRAELLRELARAIPPSLTVDPADLSRWLEDLTDELIADRLVELAPSPAPGVALRADGRPVTESELDRRFTTQAILDEEAAIVTATERRVGVAGRPGVVDGADLDRAQLDAARAVAGNAPLVLVVGPAGTGKTTALRPAVDSLQRAGRMVFGLAPTATAAAVLGEGTGMRSDTVDKLLQVERTSERSALPRGTTLVVDEAGMLTTPKMAELFALAERRQWRLALVGDPLQLSAVGRGGMFAHLVASHGAVELEAVHRFTHAWEREASLQLRAGVAEAIATYDRQGRIIDGPAPLLEDQLVRRWAELRGEGSVAVLTATNETARRLNERLQGERRSVGELGDERLDLPNGQRLHVGDIVATRRNERSTRTDRGAMLRNRARWRVEAIEPDGSVVVAAPRDGRATLPSAYVREHVQLAYAETIHAAQGRTVDRSLVLVDGRVDGTALYVGLTRGRHLNEAYVATEPDQIASDLLEEALARTSSDAPAIEIARARNRTAVRQAGVLGL